jgi:predicted metalloendopeptidase
MHKSSRRIAFAASIGLLAAVAGSASAQSNPGASPAAKASALENFGFPYGFSVETMDRKADPRKDFRRYAAGPWLDAAIIPSDTVRISSIDVLAKRVEAQIGAVLDAAARASPTAAKGSPMQQVGDFYTAGMDERRLTELGAAPIKPEFDRIAAADGRKGLAESLARLATVTNDTVFFSPVVSTDNSDRTRYAMFVVDADLPLGLDNYLKPENKKIRDAYAKRIADTLVIAGSTPDEASANAAKILAIETRIAGKKLTPVEKRDPAKRFATMRYDEVKAMLGNVDLDAFFAAMGLPTGGNITLQDKDALRERNALLAELPPADLKAYLRWELLRRMSAYLTPAFIGPNKAFSEALYGKMDIPPRNRLVAVEVENALGHPLGQLYVAKNFSPETRKAAEALVSLVRAEFRGRIVRSTWLSPATRREALTKIDAMKVRVGYPTEWIDYSAVDIRRDDYFGNVVRLNEFKLKRDVARLGKPVKEDTFAIPTSTLPTVINAAYQPSSNSIEIPAAFLQPPFYDAKADAAVNFCALGAVIGHEFTHGFDSTGRLYDAKGNIRDWWTPADAKHFAAEAQKLVKQAAAVEVLPGLHINGELSVGENLADVGGVSLAYAALQRHLRSHPKDNRKIDGLTPAQRCYLTWGQAWADKSNEGYLKQVLPVDGHPPGVYRMIAPSQHEKSFYEAFGIRAGDPMWFDPKNWVAIW